MRSRTARSLVAALIVAAGAMGYSCLRDPSPAGPSRSPSAAPAPVAAADPGRRTPADAPKAAATHTVSDPTSRYFDGVHDYAQLMKKVKAAGDDADAHYARMIAAGLCELSDAQLDRGFARKKQREGASPEAEASFEAYKTYRRRFCKRWDGLSFGEAAGEMAQVESDSDLLTSTQLTYDEDKERATAMALEILRTSHSDVAIRNAANYLTSVGDAWTDGKEVVEGSYLAKQLPQIQRLAAYMVACDVGGGCGSDGFYAWSDCSMFDLCHAGVSMDEIWRRTNPPDVYEAARRMALLMRRPSD